MEKLGFKRRPLGSRVHSLRPLRWIAYPTAYVQHYHYTMILVARLKQPKYHSQALVCVL